MEEMPSDIYTEPEGNPDTLRTWTPHADGRPVGGGSWPGRAPNG